MYHSSEKSKIQPTLFDPPATYNYENQSDFMSNYQGLFLNEILSEKLRLILSTFQDGFGMLDLRGMNTTLPGWRDFERATAVVFDGRSSENKALFDVLVPVTAMPSCYYGISCKMRNLLDDTIRSGAVYTELSNSNKQFWQEIESAGIARDELRSHPAEVGKALLSRLHKWQDAVSHLNGGNIVLNKSFFLTLSYNKQQQYQLHQFSHELPQADDLRWEFPQSTRSSDGTSKRLIGYQETHKLFEWYFDDSGGQLKYYPRVSDCLWKSNIFQLQPLQFVIDVKAAITQKVKSYFPEQWQALQGSDKTITTDNVP